MQAECQFASLCRTHGCTRTILAGIPVHFYSAPQCSHCKRCTSYGNSVRPSVCLSVCHTPVLCQNAPAPGIRRRSLDHGYDRDGGVAAAASHRPHQVNDQQMSRPLPQPLQAEISRKTVKTVPLKLSEYLDKNVFYNYEEQLIRFSLNCCTRACNSV